MIQLPEIETEVLIPDELQTEHMVDDAMGPVEAMETFRMMYKGIRVMVYEDCMVYATSPGWSDKCVDHAREIIKYLRLPLEANSTKALRKDCFTIKPTL